MEFTLHIGPDMERARERRRVIQREGEGKERERREGEMNMRGREGIGMRGGREGEEKIHRAHNYQCAVQWTLNYPDLDYPDPRLSGSRTEIIAPAYNDLPMHVVAVDKKIIVYMAAK